MNIRSIFFATTASMLLTLSSCGPEQKKQNDNSITISEDARANKSDDEIAAMTDEERAEYYNTDAPDEGLSQMVYDDLEMPAPLTKSTEVILMKSQFSVSYNATTMCPNYVCWHLTEERTRGDMRRPDDFTPDVSLAPAMQVTTHDYSGSGYDRGHMCPAADNKNSQTAMYESFSMTNVCPQRHDLNEGDWNELEQLCREWARNYGDLYICCGPIFDSKQPAKIGKRNRQLQISVPDRFFKVVLMMGQKPRAIGFIFNNDGTRKDLRSYAVSVDKVEQITGIDFYPQLSDEIENKVERMCNPADWNL